MPLRIVRNDITKMTVDAIVNAANSTLLGGGGVDGSIHKAAGKELLEECKKLGGCKTGDAKVTGAYNLPCQYVIHTVGPVWRGGVFGEKKLLTSCYRRSLEIAKEKNCETVAFPLISAGAYGYPKDKALRVAVDTIGSFLLENEMTVYLVVFDKASYGIGKRLFDDISEYIDDRYCEEAKAGESERLNRNIREAEVSKTIANMMPSPADESVCEATFDAMPSLAPREEARRSGRRRERNTESISFGASQDTAELPSLDEMLKMLDESFSQMLLRKIDERGMTDAECYKKANIDRKLFSKIRSDIHYKPRKQTAIAFAIALELSLPETEQMLKKAGYALSHSNKFDIIIEYFIRKGNYNIFEINEVLFAFDQNLLGA
ncbi:MAG: O-acetyl-ADP-ribose deacetylase [Acutalibacteraceae bacterium]